MDSQYLQKVLAGDHNAFRYFVRKYQDMAFSLAMSIVKTELIAEEAVQDAFVKAYQNIHTFNQKSKFTTWLYRIVVNESLRKIRRKQFDTAEVEELEDTENSINDAFRSLHEMEQREIINQVLLELPESESLLLRLFYLDEMSMQEIKEVTDLSLANIKVILHRARKRFYTLLERNFKHEINSLL